MTYIGVGANLKPTAAGGYATKPRLIPPYVPRHTRRREKKIAPRSHSITPKALLALRAPSEELQSFAEFAP